MILTKDQVQKILPHREPFLFIDNIVEIHYSSGKYDFNQLVGNTVTASYFTDPAHPIFKGHFPDRPILPGVCQVEMMAQVSCFAAMNREDLLKVNAKKIALAMINNAKFRSPVLPNSHLKIKAEIIRVRKSLLITKSQVYEGEALLSEAEITTSFEL